MIDALLANEKAGASQPELDLLERWAAVHRFVPDAAKVVAGWVSFRHAHAIDFEDLVPLRRPEPKLTNITEGPAEHRRRRDGFGLTDGRMSRREVASESDYCMYCHEREKDSCSKGMHDKQGGMKKNPIGVTLRGCPLNEKIGEMHVLRRDGDSIAALAMVVVDNPMLPGTGHRICNDCMKACIFQKQEPVNIPQAETGRPHRRARHALGLRDLRPADALESAQPRAPGGAAVHRQERAGGRHGAGGLDAVAAPAQRRVRRGGDRRAQDRAVAG